MSELAPTRVLHIFHQMDRGGAETWIVNVMRHIHREQIQFDFLLESDRPGAYDEEIRSMGGGLYHGGNPKRLPQFAGAFRRVVREYGPYDVVHSHVHHSSGFMLALAASCGVPIRVAHSHSDTRGLQRSASLPRRAYYRTAEALIGRFSTVGLAASREAAASLFGEDWERDARYRVLHCGIDLQPFTGPIDREAVRARLGIPLSSFVVGHVGRFAAMKNHLFLVDVFARIYEKRDEARLLLVGDGPLRGEVERKVEGLGLAEAVVFAGSRSDVPEILRGAMDVFVFPSTYEGLGLAIVEALAAGLPSTVSDTVPVDALIVPELVQSLSLLEGPERAQVITKQCGAMNERGSHTAVERIIESPFNLETGIDALERAYLGR